MIYADHIVIRGGIGLASFLIGFSFLEKGFKRREYYSLEIYILSGLCILTVYSQFFSLFYKVGKAAFLAMAILCMITGLLLRKSIAAYLKDLRRAVRWYHLALIALLGGLLLILTVQSPMHYDTDLYHAQMIRWIEEYGVVKGLGNLHNRFAYNSSFFCLQALFSLKFMLGSSLHSVNGFVSFLILSYSVLTLNMFKKQKLMVSDIVKLAIPFYLILTDARFLISSPGSDILPQLLAAYLVAKWSEYMEQGQRDVTVYGVLALLAVWAVTVKLSAAMVALFAVYPAVSLLGKRQWKRLAWFLTAAAVVVLPFLIRNVVISGYLLYPYPSIDLFDVDWKMPSYAAEEDSIEIRAWGRGVTQEDMYDAPASVWLPKWYDSLSGAFRILLWLNVPLLFWSVCDWIIMVRHKAFLRLNMMAVIIASLCTWFFLAPLPRYGAIYLWLLPAVALGALVKRRGHVVPEYTVVLGYLLYCGISLASFAGRYLPNIPEVKPFDYNARATDAVEVQGITFYVAVDSDQAGYHAFPGVPDMGRLDRMEFRTGRLEDGFRPKRDM